MSDNELDPLFCINYPTKEQLQVGWDGPGWYFWDEGGELHGPFASREEAAWGRLYYREDLYDDGGL